MTAKPDFTRFRVTSIRFNSSVTAEVAYDSFERVPTKDVASQCSCEHYSVHFIGQPEGNLPTFNVVPKLGEPSNIEGILRAIAMRLESCYDNAVGELVIR